MFQNGGCEGLTAGAVIKSKSDNIFIVRKQFYYMYFSLLASSTGSSSGTTFLLLGLGLSSLSESILKAAVQHFEVAHAASSCGLSSLCLDAPVNQKKSYDILRTTLSSNNLEEGSLSFQDYQTRLRLELQSLFPKNRWGRAQNKQACEHDCEHNMRATSGDAASSEGVRRPAE